MNKGLVAFLAFSCGTISGFFTGKKLLEQHYRQLVDEEISSVKQAFRRQNRHEMPSKDSKTPHPTEKKIQPQNIHAKPKTDYTAYYPTKKTEEEETTKAPEDYKTIYVIPPDEFDTLEDYEAISLKLYADGVVTDDDNRAMSEEDIERTITRDSLNHIDEYEPGSVFVRNDALHVDYEVLTDERTYEEVLAEQPYLRE